MALTTRQIAEAALLLLEETGLDGLTTRRLAQALKVSGPSLYHHFGTKNELLGLMATLMLRQSLSEIDAALPWERWLRRLADITRAMILRHRDSARLLTASLPTNDMQRALIPAATRQLVAAGFPRDRANETIAAVASFVIGWTINEQNPAILHFMESVMTVDEGFSFGIEALIAGIGRSVPPARHTAVARAQADGGEGHARRSDGA